MRIAVFTDVFLPKVDGVVTSLEQLVLELDRQRHEVLVIAPQAEGAPKKMGTQVELCYLPSLPALVYPGLKVGLPSLKLRNTVKKFDPEVFLILTPLVIGRYGLFFSKRMKRPSVGIFHGYFMKPEYIQIIGIKKGVKHVEALGWAYARKFFDSCNVIISPSREVKEDIVAHKFKKPVVVCSNGIKIETKLTPEIETQLKRIQKEKGLNPDKTVLFTGRLSKEKNLEMLLRVFKQVVEKDFEAKLLIIGGGPIEEELKDQVLELQLQEQVVFWGEIMHQDLVDQQLVRLGTIFCTCSTSEVQPMSVIEAMLFGLPVVMPAVPAMRELVNEQTCLVNPVDSIDAFSEKICQLLENKELRKKCSRASLKDSEKFKVEEAARQYLEVFEQEIKKASQD